MSSQPIETVMLDGSSLTIDDLVRLSRNPDLRIRCGDEAMERVRIGRAQIESIVGEYTKNFEAFKLSKAAEDRPSLTYGVTTGFGEFKGIPIPPERLERLQRNILLSHAVGVGESSDADDSANYFAPDVVRAALCIRLNTFLKGNSGIRPEMVRFIETMVNEGIVPLVPIRGSVGSSGDLCPLSHLFATLLGEGRFWVVKGDTTAKRLPREARPATELSAVLGCTVPLPSYKEGLCLSNGATFCAALLALSVADAQITAAMADASAAMSLEAVCGRTRAMDPKVQAARGHGGQIDSAANIRALVEGSTQVDRAADVQDSYSVRCTPQVHGASRDSIAYARMIVEKEINAATDNPLFFPGEEPWDLQFQGNWAEKYSDLDAYSAGNFHGQPLGMAADFMAMGLAELGSISERRCQMLLDGKHSRNLPGNLIPERGVNTGYMIAQYSAASLVSENKVLCHPSSVDSIPTSANTEDHVAMATTACRKLRTVLGNLQAVLAIELMVATQAVEWRVGMKHDPNKGSVWERTQEQEAGVLEMIEEAKRETREFTQVTAVENRGKIAEALGRGTASCYLAVRKRIEPMLCDRVLDEDLRRVRKAVEDGSLWSEVETALADGFVPIRALAWT